jgi:hypothetical protein
MSNYVIKYSVYFMLFVYVVSPFVQYLYWSPRLPIPCKVVVVVGKMKYAVTTVNIYSKYKTYFSVFSGGGGGEVNYGQWSPRVSRCLDFVTVFTIICMCILSCPYTVNVSNNLKVCTNTNVFTRLITDNDVCVVWRDFAGSYFLL